MSVDRPSSEGEQPAELGPSGPVGGRRLRTGLLLVIAVGVTAGVVVALVSGGPAMIAAVARLPLAALALVVALDVASWGAEGLAFAALSGARGVRGWLRMSAVYVGGGFPGLVTPFGSGAIPGWAYALTREGLTAGEASAVLGARGLITSALFVAAGAVALAVVPATLGGSSATVVLGFAGLLVVFGAVIAIVARPREAARVLTRMLGGGLACRVAGAERAGRAAAAAAREAERFAHALRTLARDRPLALAAALGGILVSRACLLAILPVLMFGLGYRGAVVPLVLTIVGVWALASGSPTPGGTGVVEVGLTGVLAAFVPLRAAGAAALLWRGITFYFDLLVGWALFARVLGRPKRPDAMRLP